ncbi:hypothetical protein Tco_0167414 [Tanacetum coccineum]
MEFAPLRKKIWVRRLRQENHFNFIGIQETKTSKDDLNFIHSLWGGQNCDYAIKKPNGLSGGIIALWDNSMFVSRHFISKWPNAQLLALPRDLSDHCPLLLKTHSSDFGPIPFKFFNSWLLNGEFPSIVSFAWSQCHSRDHIHPPAFRLKEKFQTLKKFIREWREKVILCDKINLSKIATELELLDWKAENDGLSQHDIEERLSQKS